MSEAFIAPLEYRGVVSVIGTDALKYLNGIVTNEVAHLAVGEAAYAGLLSPQGKILFDFIALRTSDGFLLDTKADKAADLTKRLAMYKLRAAVTIASMPDAFSIFAIWGGTLPAAGTSAHTSILTDPRHPALGCRLIVQRAHAVGVLATIPHRSATQEDYTAHRIALGVPEGGKDFEFGDAYPHEADFDIFNGVSFKKGCYIGQEVVSRMQHKTVVRKRVVRIEGDSALTSGADITHNGVTFGRVGSVVGRNSLALLRLDRYAEAASSGVVARAGDVPIHVHEADLARYTASLTAHEKA